MEEQSFLEKEALLDSSTVQKLSESRPKFKPVLVKKLLADESDDDSEDSNNEAQNSDNSDEESDSLDGCQPLSEECNSNFVSLNLVAKTDVELNIVNKNDFAPDTLTTGKRSIDVFNVQVKESIETATGNTDENTEGRSVSNILRKDSLKLSGYATNNSDKDKFASTGNTDENTEGRSVSNILRKDSLKLSGYATNNSDKDKLASTSNTDENTDGRSASNILRKDSLKFSCYATNNSDKDKLASSSKHKSPVNLEKSQSTLKSSQWQSQLTLDKRKSSPVKDLQEPTVKSKYSPELRRLSSVSFVSDSKDIPVSQFESNTDLKETQELRRYSSASTGKSYCTNNETSDDKISVSSKIPVDQSRNVKISTAHSTLNTTHGVLDTPMKHSQETVRPNPCTSHRNIFQTPQSKVGNEFTKNPIQTPATIFSHWSQKHMAQTPMNNQIPSVRDPIQTPVTRESMQTPATMSVQSQSSRVERPRYYNNVEGKSVRRPLAETMFSASVQNPQLPRLPETSQETQSNLPVTKESSSAVIQENVGDKKPVYSSLSHITFEIKENKNSNNHDIVKSENHPGYQSSFKSEAPDQSVPQNRHSSSTQPETKPKFDYQQNVYSGNVNAPNSRNRKNYENYKSRENQNVHPPAPMPPEQIPPSIQYPKPQQTNFYNSRQKIITVQGQQYLFLSVIGHGMSCEVVRAQDLSNLELRAIKCVNLNKMDKESVQGCLQEICMLDKLKAPCVVHMYNFEVKQPWVHVVMEIGDTDLSRLLKSMLAEKKKLPLTMILYYWTEMLTAVKHIHDNGVIHSDLKPANFLLVRGRLKLIDFGIASSINSDMTSVLKNCSIGTLNYISPEALMDVNAGSDSPNQNVKYKISYKSDVWSLGCILYSLVYGCTPFNHIRQQWGKISAITDPKHKINFPLVSGNEPVPLILIDVMRKCLQRESKARPAVADLLEIPYLQGNITQALIPNIPSNILLKIKHALSDEEWKQFSEIFSKR